MIEKKSITILLAEDDAEDRELIIEAWRRDGLINDIRSVKDGEELLDYFRQKGAYSDPSSAPRPGLILLDLNMPKIDGRAALKVMKADPELKRIPVVVMTTSNAEEDVYRSYDVGANAYIVKPINFDSMVEIMKTLRRYWFDIVALPEDGRDQ